MLVDQYPCVTNFYDTRSACPMSNATSGTNAMATTTATNGVFSLENILGADHESLEHPGINGSPSGWDEETPEKPPAEGYCIECEGKKACSVISISSLKVVQTSRPRSYA